MAKTKTTVLKEWREKHMGELETNLKVAQTIRDSTTAAHKDRLEATKIISRLLGALAPEKVESGKAKEPEKDRFDCTPEELAMVDNFLRPNDLK